MYTFNTLAIKIDMICNKSYQFITARCIGIAKKLIGKMENTDIMAFILNLVMIDCGVTTDQYMIIASYCLRKIRDVGDLDVIVQKNAYNKLKKSKHVKFGKAHISNDEKILIELPSLGNNAEIEIFPKKPNVGFPNEYYSLENLKKNNKLISDDFGNQYFNLETCIKHYSSITVVNGKYIFGGKFTVDRQRVIKNLGHLKTIKKSMKKSAPKIVDVGIKHLTSIL